jgi:hypothetical protein
MVIQNLEWQWMVAGRLLQQHWRWAVCMQMRLGLGDLSGEYYSSLLRTDAAEGFVRQQPAEAQYKETLEGKVPPLLAAVVVNCIHIVTAVYLAATLCYNLASSSTRPVANADERASKMGSHAVAASLAVQMRPH